MGSPAIFNGKFTKLLTQNGILNSNGSINQNDGVRNYVAYSQFEQNNTTGWSLGTIGTLTNGLPTGSPTFGSGANANLAISAQSTGALRGSYSLQYASSAATTAGNMLATDALAIDPADQAKVLSFKFYYSVTANPSNGNFSGTSSNSFGVAVYDVTNSSFIAVQGAFGMTQSSGVGIASGTFQTNSNTASLRFIVYNVNASAGAITLLMDDFFVGPQQVNIGPVVTDWVSYTPTFTGFGIPTNVAFRSRRVGDSLQVQGYFQAGTTTAVSAQVSLGYSGGNSNVTIDTSKIAVNAVVGTAGYGGSITNFYGAYILATGANNFLNFSNQTNAANNLTAVNGNAFTPTAFIQFEAQVPIVGWSSNVQMSSDSYQGIVAFNANVTTTSVGANSTVTCALSSVLDTNNAISGNSYVIPVTGVYELSASGLVGTLSGTLSDRNVFIEVDGVSVVASTESSTYFSNHSPYVLRRLNAGQVVTWRINCGAVAINSVSLIVNACRLSGPSVIAATETVAASYACSAGQSITPASADTMYPFTNLTTKYKDTHNAFNPATGTFTAPVSGIYRVSGSMTTPSGTATYRSGFGVNTTSGFNILSALTVNTSIQTSLPCTWQVNLNAGQTVTFGGSSSSTLAQTWGAADGRVGWFTIERIGN